MSTRNQDNQEKTRCEGLYDAGKPCREQAYWVGNILVTCCLYEQRAGEPQNCIYSVVWRASNQAPVIAGGLTHEQAMVLYTTSIDAQVAVSHIQDVVQDLACDKARACFEILDI